MNANVFLRTDEETLRSSHWPEEIRNDPAVLDKCKLAMNYPFKPVRRPKKSYNNFFPLQTMNRLSGFSNLPPTRMTGPNSPR